MLSAKIRGSPSGSLCPIPVAAMDFAFGQTPCSGQIARSFASFVFRPKRRVMRILPGTPPTLPLARRWAGRARSLCRPRFLYPANAPPRVVSSVFLPPLAFRSRGTFSFSLMRNIHPLPLSGGYREGGLCPLPFPARDFVLNHASCPGDFLPCFFLFALPRQTLKGAACGCCRCRPLFSSSSSPYPGALILSSFNLLAGLVYGDCAVRFLSGEKGSNKKANFALVQTQLETDSLLSTFLKNLLL